MEKNINYYTLFAIRNSKLLRLNYFKFDSQLATHRNEIRKTIYLIYRMQHVTSSFAEPEARAL